MQNTNQWRIQGGGGPNRPRPPLLSDDLNFFGRFFFFFFCLRHPGIWIPGPPPPWSGGSWYPPTAITVFFLNQLLCPNRPLPGEKCVGVPPPPPPPPSSDSTFFMENGGEFRFIGPPFCTNPGSATGWLKIQSQNSPKNNSKEIYFKRFCLIKSVRSITAKHFGAEFCEVRNIIRAVAKDFKSKGMCK